MLHHRTTTSSMRPRHANRTTGPVCCSFRFMVKKILQSTNSDVTGELCRATKRHHGWAATLLFGVSQGSTRRMPRRCGHSQRRSQRHKTAAAASSAVEARPYERSLYGRRRNSCSSEAFQACSPKIAHWKHSTSLHPRMRASGNKTVPAVLAQVVREVCSAFNASSDNPEQRENKQLEDDVAVKHRTPTLMQPDRAELLIHPR